jgi:hypothetical protein
MAAPAEQKDTDILKVLRDNTIRRVDFDVCYPASDEEYRAMGKNAVVMLTADSVSSSELPLKTAYVISKGVRVPLQRLAVFDKHQTGGNGSNEYTEQISFYLLPIYLMKRDAKLMVDFNGPRSGFEVTTYSAHEGLDPSLPAFLRLDEYDSPSDPDLNAVSALLQREYPDYFNASTSK